MDSRNLRDRGWRRWRRHVVQSRRLKKDFADHYDNVARACYTDPKLRAFLADTPNRCSGPCCGNPRRFFGETTIPERRNALKRGDE